MLKNCILMSVAALVLWGSAALASDSPTSLDVQLPAYEVSKRGDFDRVTIPGGQMLIEEEGRPLVPYYIKLVEYPRGHRVQDVVLKGRSNSQTATGLRLPPVTIAPYPVPPGEMKEGTYPTKDFDWRLYESADGGSQLVLAVYPFQYDPKTSAATYYRKYVFDVTQVSTDLALGQVTTDRLSYNPSDTVRIRFELENSGDRQNALAVVAVRQAFTDSLVAELPTKTLELPGGDTSIALDWWAGGRVTGHCLAEVTLRDKAGSTLDREVTGFRLGIPSIEIADFEANPRQFSLGDSVKFALEYANTGSCELGGQAIVEVRTGDSLVDTFYRDFESLAPGQSGQFRGAWDTKGAKKSLLYEVIGYVSYEATASMPKKSIVSTNARPTASFSFTPESPGIETEVRFDAAGSADEDGELVEYRWEFGDGGEAEGIEVTHTYYQAGDYGVKLTVVDNEGGTAEADSTVTVVK
jgi:hypothetical protein